MSGFLKEEEYNRSLLEYYMENYGENEEDLFYEKPANNVIVFKRGNKIITLKSHVLTGEVTAAEKELEYGNKTCFW